MRVALLLTDLCDAVGGIQTFNRALVSALDTIACARGGEIRPLVLNDRSPSCGLATECTDYRSFAGNKSRFALGALRFASRADVVLYGHAHFLPIACAVIGARTLLVVHGIEVWKRLSALQRLGLSRVDRILAVSRFTSQRMAEANNLELSRFSILPNTLDPEYTPADQSVGREELNLPSGSMILTVARLDARQGHKGVDIALAALPQVLSVVSDAFYVVVGDGSDRPRLTGLAAELGVADRVHFVGWVPAKLLPFYYESCDVFALPSWGEGFGIVVLEAMAQAKPCVGARAGGLPEVIEHGTTGLLVAPQDPRELSASLVELLSDGELRRTLGRAGKKRLESEFTAEAFRQKLETALWT